MAQTVISASAPRAVYPDLANRRVVVTGAAAGIGRAIASAFASQGCRLVVSDIDGGQLDAAAAEMTPADSVVAVVGSVADPEAVEALFAAAEEAFGGVDVLVNNAGISMNRATLDLTVEDWRRALDINLTGVFLCSQAAGRRMIAAGKGVIINLASMYGVVAAPERLAYCVAKSGVVMLTKALAVEWAGFGLRINAIAPGYIRTDLVGELVRLKRLDEADLIRRTPQGRLGTVEEVADLALFLASGSAHHITGQTIGIDGGWTAYGYI